MLFSHSQPAASPWGNITGSKLQTCPWFASRGGERKRGDGNRMIMTQQTISMATQNAILTASKSKANDSTKEVNDAQ